MKRDRAFRLARALSLVEVLASIVIIGGGVTTMLVAQSNSVATLKTARLESQADEFARNLIARWRLSHENVSKNASGDIPGQQRWTWRRQSSPFYAGEKVKATLVTLTIVRAGSQAEGPWVRRYEWLEAREG